ANPDLFSTLDLELLVTPQKLLVCLHEQPPEFGLARLHRLHPFVEKLELCQLIVDGLAEYSRLVRLFFGQSVLTRRIGCLRSQLANFLLRPPVPSLVCTQDGIRKVRDPSKKDRVIGNKGC